MHEKLISDFSKEVRGAWEDYKLRLEESGRADYSKLLPFLRGCESPLEQLLLIDFTITFAAEPNYDSDLPYLKGMIIDPELYKFPLKITPQQKIAIDKQNFRADFLFEIFDFRDPEQTIEKIIVEIDGHDFHERTKEQAIRDRSRDRLMTREEFRVLRFTGTEVFQNREKVNSEIEDFLVNLLKKCNK